MEHAKLRSRVALLLHLNGQEASCVGVELRPMIGEAAEVILRDDVMVAGRRCIETIQNDSDEEVHEHIRYRQRKAGEYHAGERHGVQGQSQWRTVEWSPTYVSCVSMSWCQRLNNNKSGSWQ